MSWCVFPKFKELLIKPTTNKFKNLPSCLTNFNQPLKRSEIYLLTLVNCDFTTFYVFND
jgi:hypothetical protein